MSFASILKKVRSIEDRIDAGVDRLTKEAAEELQRKRKENILYIPRKKLRLKKAKKRKHIWLIEDRLEDRVMRLDAPTSKTKEGITSGLRSAIIKADNGDYVKLKGVAEKVFKALGGDRGVFAYAEAAWEQVMSFVFSRMDPTHCGISPYFIEAYPTDDKLEPGKIRNVVDTKSRILIETMHTHKIKSASKLNKFWNKIYVDLPKKGDKYWQGNFVYVGGLKIKGDTRLDEVIWHLTRNKFTGDKKARRDNLLHALCFFAGIAKANLTHRGYIWSENMAITNNHIGNFVLYPQLRLTRVGYSDLGLLSSKDMFKDEKAFYKHCEKEIGSFRRDFFDEVTCNTTTYLKYRNFSRSLRQECFDTFRTGYYFCLYRINKEGNTNHPVKPFKSLMLPEKPIYNDEEFRAELKDLM